jgi:xanthine dehydrogenase YagT iron-sulfur-binding subunit
VKSFQGELQNICLHVNGVERVLAIEPRLSLLDALRDHLGLPGTKKGCDQGACGACTVLVDGERINSCLALAIQYQGREIVTIEGLAKSGVLHPMQRAFIEHDGFHRATSVGETTYGTAVSGTREFELSS